MLDLQELIMNVMEVEGLNLQVALKEEEKIVMVFIYA